MTRPEILERLKILRESAISILLGNHRVPYPPEQFQHLVIDVADVLSRTASKIVPTRSYLTGGNASLSPQDEDLLREAVEELKREGILIDGLDAANPRWPFFRLTTRAKDILQRQKLASSTTAAPETFRVVETSGSGKNEFKPDSERANTASAPKAFISYSWDDDDHKQWVREFAARLRADGVDATLDQWSLAPGDRLPQFMEKAVRENSYVIIVCTENYKSKSDNRKGGVGYEGDIMTAEVYAKGNHRKFIPVLRRGNWDIAVPSWLSGKYSIDLSAGQFSEKQYKDLLDTLHDLRDKAPPIGTAPRSMQIDVLHTEAVRTPTEESDEFINQCYKRFINHRRSHPCSIPDVGIREIGAVIFGDLLPPDLDQAYIWSLSGVRRFSGWRPFVSLLKVDSTEAIYDEESVESFSYLTEMFNRLDFSRIERSGRFYYLEGFPDDLSTRIKPREQLEFAKETERIAESVATILLFAKKFCGDNTTNRVCFRLRWRGVAKRHLTSWTTDRNFYSSREAASDEVVSHTTIPVSTTIEDIGPHVEALLKPLFRCFGGWAFESPVIQQIVAKTIRQDL